MMHLSQYVVDPLVTSVETWYHPITHAQVKLSTALRARLPEIMLVDLTQEASHPDEILNQLLACELRDLGFLIPSFWRGSEAECIAYHRYPQRGKKGFFGCNTIPVSEVGSARQGLFLSVSAEASHLTPRGGVEYLRWQSQAEESHTHEFPCYEVDFSAGKVQRTQDFWEGWKDLGHISTVGLSDGKIGEKLGGIIPFFASSTLPVIFADVPGGVYPILREYGVWNRKNQEKKSQIIVFDREVRFGHGVDVHVEQKNRVTSANFFAHLQWNKKNFDSKDVYVGPSRFARTRAKKEIIQEVVSQNIWITSEEMMKKDDGKFMASSIDSSAIAVIHLNVFDDRSHQCLKYMVSDVLGRLCAQEKLKGIVFWGTDTITAEHIDFNAFYHTMMTVVSSLSMGNNPREELQ